MTNWPRGPKQCKNWCRQQKIISCTGKQRVCAREKQHSDAREIRLNRQWSAAALWCLLCTACWESCQGRLVSMVPEMSLFQNPSLTVNTYARV